MPRIQEGGFSRVMRRGLQESEGRSELNKIQDERQSQVAELMERFKNVKGLGFAGGKLEEAYEKNPRKTEAMLLMLRETEKAAFNVPMLRENFEQQKSLREDIRKGKLTEDVAQTSGFLGITPQDIVKVMRIAYPNSNAAEIFDFWGMTSMKDTLYKLETQYGTTARGATANNVIYENYNDGRYSSAWDQDQVTIGAPGTTFSGILATFPILPFHVAIVVDGEQVATDNGSGVFVGPYNDTVANPINASGTNTINYLTGAYTLTFVNTLQTTDVVYIYSQYDTEQTTLFGDVGNVLLNLVAYDYRATPWPLAIEWTRFTEELMQSKLQLSAKEMLLAGSADVFRKGIDEYCITKGIQATTWTSAITFDTDFSAAGSDSSYAHAQSILTAIQNAELKTYAALGRQADKSSLVVDALTLPYLKKHRLWNTTKVSSKIGIYKAGELDAYDVYLAPYGLMTDTRSSNQGNIYVFGKGNDNLNVDAVVSVGTWKAGLTTQTVELKNFNSQMGLAFYGDIRVNNRKFATKVQLNNLTVNS